MTDIKISDMDVIQTSYLSDRSVPTFVPVIAKIAEQFKNYKYSTEDFVLFIRDELLKDTYVDNDKLADQLEALQEAIEKKIPEVVNYTLVDAYKTTDDIEAPDNSYLNSSSNPPSGWSTDSTNLTGNYLWKISARLMDDGSFYNWASGYIWTEAQCIINGSTSVTGADNGNLNYLYFRSNTDPDTICTSTYTPVDLNPDSVEEYFTSHDFITWTVGSETITAYDRPQGVTSSLLFEYACVAKYNLSSKTWSAYSTPFIWSHYGSNGLDGDGIEYIFKLTSSFSRPEIDSANISSTEYLTDDYLPSGWTDNPFDVSESYPYEWVALRKLENGRWLGFSSPTLWAKYGKDGALGPQGDTATDAIYFATVYKTSIELPTKPTGGEYSFASKALIAPNDWSTTITQSPVWESHKHFYLDSIVSEEWSEPTRVISSASELLNETDAIHVLNVILYKESSETPELPTFSSTACGMDETSWETAAESDKYPDFILPELANGWTLEVPTTASILIWMTSNTFHSDGTNTGWSGPYKYVDVLNIIQKAKDEAKALAEAAIASANTLIATLQEQINSLNSDIAQCQSDIAALDPDDELYGSFTARLDGLEAEYATLTSQLTALLNGISDLEAKYANFEISADGLSSAVMDSFYETIIDKEISNGSVNVTLENNLSYIYTLAANDVDEDKTTKTNIKSYTVVSDATTPYSKTFAAEGTSTGYYGGNFFNVDGTKLTITRTDSTASSGRILVRKVLSSTLSNIYQTADEIKLRVGLTESSAAALQSSISQLLVRLDGISMSSGISEYAIDKIVSVPANGTASVTTSMSTTYYPVIAYSDGSTGDVLASLSAQFTAGSSTLNDKVYSITNDSDGNTNVTLDDVTTNLVVTSYVEGDSTYGNGTGRTIKFTNSTSKDITVNMNYNIASAVSSIDISPESITAQVTSKGDEIKTSIIEMLPNKISEVVTDGDTAASIIMGINDELSKEDGSYIALTAAQIIAAGNLIAQNVTAESLNVDNVTYINGKEDIYTNGESGAYKTGVDLMAVGVGTNGESHFKADGTGTLAGGLISWGPYKFADDGSIAIDENGNATLDASGIFGLYIKGIVNALSGQIGGWTIAENYLYSKSSNNILLLNPSEGIKSTTNGTINYQLNLDGSASFALNKVQFNNDGSFYLSPTGNTSDGIYFDTETSKIKFGSNVALEWQTSWNSNVNEAAGSYSNTDVLEYLKELGVVDEDGNVSAPDLADYMKSDDFDSALTAKLLNSNGKILSTYIDGDSIVTGYLAANKITAGQINTDDLSVNKINGSDVTNIDWEALSNGTFKAKTDGDLTIEGTIHAKGLELESSVTIPASKITGIDDEVANVINSDETLSNTINTAIDNALKDYDGGDAFTTLQSRVTANEKALESVYTKTEVDENIANAETSILTLTATDISTAVGNATKEYDEKLGDYVLAETYNSYITLTAESINSKVDSTTYSEDQTALDTRISNVEQTANGVTSKVSLATYDIDKKTITTRISTIELTASGISSRVKTVENDYVKSADLEITDDKISAVVTGLSLAGITIDVENETGSIDLYADEINLSDSNKTKLITVSESTVTLNPNITVAWGNISGAPSDIDELNTILAGYDERISAADTAAQNATLAAADANAAAEAASKNVNTLDEVLAATSSVTSTLSDFFGKYGDNSLTTYIDNNNVITDTIISNVVDADYINALNITADSVASTWVYAGNINASQITAGKISADYIDVDNLSVNTINGHDVSSMFGNDNTINGGSIGGWTATDTALYNGLSSFAGTDAGTYIGTDGIKSINGSDTSKYVSILDGTLTTNNITASSGSIGGWHISSSGIYSGNKSSTSSTNTGIFIGSSGTIAAGAYDSTTRTSPFVITSSGALTATKASITGGITATSGSIGGLTIKSGYLTTDATNLTSISDTASGMFLSSAGIRFNTSNTANYVSLTPANGIYATKGTIGGLAVTANGMTYNNEDDSGNKSYLCISSGGYLSLAYTLSGETSANHIYISPTSGVYLYSDYTSSKLWNLDKTGSGWLANLNIKWDATGALEVTGEISAQSFKIIESSTALTSSDLDNGVMWLTTYGVAKSIVGEYKSSNVTASGLSDSVSDNTPVFLIKGEDNNFFVLNPLLLNNTSGVIVHTNNTDFYYSSNGTSFTLKTLYYSGTESSSSVYYTNTDTCSNSDSSGYVSGTGYYKVLSTSTTYNHFHNNIYGPFTSTNGVTFYVAVDSPAAHVIKRLQSLTISNGVFTASSTIVLMCTLYNSIVYNSKNIIYVDTYEAPSAKDQFISNLSAFVDSLSSTTSNGTGTLTYTASTDSTISTNLTYYAGANVYYSGVGGTTIPD